MMILRSGLDTLYDYYDGTQKGPVYVWVVLSPRFEDTDYLSEDLFLEEWGTHSLGQSFPEWFQDAKDTSGLEDFISHEGFLRAQPQSGIAIAETWTKWGLEHGIAPSQPFLLRIDYPIYDRGDGFELEDDVFYESKIIDIVPWPQAKIIRAWEQWTNHVARVREDLIQPAKILRDRQKTDPTALYLISSGYYSTGGYVDEMTPPDGISVSLHSRHQGRGVSSQLAYGKNDKGNYQKALAEMVGHATQTMPLLTLDFCRTLPSF